MKYFYQLRNGLLIIADKPVEYMGIAKECCIDANVTGDFESRGYRAHNVTFSKADVICSWTF